VSRINPWRRNWVRFWDWSGSRLNNRFWRATFTCYRRYKYLIRTGRKADRYSLGRWAGANRKTSETLKCNWAQQNVNPGRPLRAGRRIKSIGAKTVWDSWRVRKLKSEHRAFEWHCWVSHNRFTSLGVNCKRLCIFYTKLIGFKRCKVWWTVAKSKNIKVKAYVAVWCGR
jgi:hypothetical protein